MKKLRYLRPAGLVAVGVFLGRGAHADTTLDFNSDASSCSPPQIENPNAPPGITNFGNYAGASSGGVTVSGFGTPNIGLVWGGIPSPDTRWEYYNDGGAVWAGVQLQASAIGTTHKLTFVPNSASAQATIKSFNFHGYYNDNERFTYSVSVTSGTNVLFGPITNTFLSDGTKSHPVNINYTGAPGQALKLRINRIASNLGAGEVEGDQYDNAIDDIVFAQTPTTTFPAGPQVVSVTPEDDTTGLPALSLPPYQASITNGVTTVVASSIRLKFDGALVSPSPTISSAGGLTNVSYPGVATTLLSSGAHVYTLSYADNLGAFYTNEVVFNTTYSTIPPAYGSPPGSGSHQGFTFRSVVARIDTPPLDSTLARAIAQLNGTLIDPASGTPYTNAVADGTNADGSFDVTGVINYDDNFLDGGDFPGDTPFPGLDAGPYNYFSCEARLFLDLPAGYYRFGVNSDDGFEFNALPPTGVSGSPILLGLFDGGRGASDTLFDFLVQTSGVYPFQLIYFENTSLASLELFSVNTATSEKILINDTNNVNAVKSFRVIPPRIISIARSGGNVILNWAYGNPPFQVQFKNNITDAWANSGSPTSNRSATIPIQPGARFFRVVGSP